MRINRALNLVLPVYDDAEPRLDPEGKSIPPDPIYWVYSIPVSREIFERYWKSMSKALVDLATDGMGNMGPRLGLLSLKSAAEELGDWEDSEDNRGAVRLGVENGFLPEVRRLTSIIAPAQTGGWRSVPLDVAIQQKTVSDEDLDEIMGTVVFFTCTSLVAPRRRVEAILIGQLSRFEAQLTSLTTTAFAASLRTSTPGGSSGKPDQEAQGEGSPPAQESNVMKITPGQGMVTAPDGEVRPLSLPA
jgi:hypothetical protein